jgi:hypothetical protein
VIVRATFTRRRCGSHPWPPTSIIASPAETPRRRTSAPSSRSSGGRGSESLAMPFCVTRTCGSGTPCVAASAARSSSANCSQASTAAPTPPPRASTLRSVPAARGVMTEIVAGCFFSSTISHSASSAGTLMRGAAGNAMARRGA